ncbi:MAG TPA: MarR family transcriptional regulator [Candidatus Thermoplasmatota archaeon]|nr:MarR family transcriptional regulator [Candidatus Thermoplasmatota archaeon]
MPRKGQRGAFGAVRARVRKEVLRNPGVGVSEIARRLGFDQSTINYHAHILAAEGAVQIVKDGRTLRLFKPGRRSRRELAPLLVARHPALRKIVQAILRHPGINGETLAQRLKLAKSTVSYHVKKLRSQGVVTRRNGPDGQQLFVSPRFRRAFR